MKTSSSILALTALLAVATLGSTAVHVDEDPILDDARPANTLTSSEPVVDEKTWMPFRALRSMDYPQLGHLSGYTHKPRTPTSLNKLTTIKNANFHRALAQAQATPAPTIPVTRATPAPTRTNTPRATPASTTTRVTPRPTTTSSTAHHVASPPTNKKKPKAPAAHPTKQGKTGASSTSNASQQKTRSLGGNEAKQQLPSDHRHSAKQGVKKGVRHQ